MIRNTHHFESEPVYFLLNFCFIVMMVADQQLSRVQNYELKRHSMVKLNLLRSIIVCYQNLCCLNKFNVPIHQQQKLAS